MNKSKRMRNIIILPIVAVCFLLFLSQSALAATYYVSPSGNDANNGLSTSSAWKNPSYAASKAVAGDTIYLMNGIWYDQHLVFNKKGTSTAPINVKAYSGTPTLDGVDKTGIGIKIHSSSWINIEGIKVKNYQYGYWASSSNNLKITKCEFSDVALDGITTWNDVDYMIIDSVTVKNTGDHGIHLWNQNSPTRSQYITIKNSFVSNAPHNLIDIHTNVTDVVVENNEIFYTLDYTGIKDVGVYLHNGNTDNIVIRNNYFHDIVRPVEIFNSNNVQVLDNTFRNINGRAIFLAGIQGYDDEFGVFDSVFKGNTFDNVNYAFAFWAADSKFRNLDLLDNNYLKVLNKDYLVPDQHYVALSGNSGFPQILTSTNKYYTVKDIAASPYITSPVTDKPPIANAGPDVTITAGSSVTFNGGSSTDDKGISSYSWDFDASNGIQSDATGKTVSKVFSKAGKFTVTLTVTDTIGQRSSDTLIVTVNALSTSTHDEKPIANAGHDRVTTVGQKVYFGGDRSTDDKGISSYSWDFDASNGIQADAVGMYVSTTFNTAKTYTVTLTVTDTIGQKSSHTVLVVVSAPATSIPDKPPVANAGPDVTITAGSSTTFNGGASIDDKGISSYSWDFDSSNGIQGDATGKIVSRTFNTAGKFTVTLTVTDTSGQRSSDTLILTVNAIDKFPVAKAGPDVTITTGSSVTFNGGSSTDDKGISSYSWDFDASNGIQSDATGKTVSRVFNTAGKFTVTLTVTDTIGQRSSDTLIVTVNAPLTSTLDENPIANAGYNRVTTVGQKVYFGGDRSTDDKGISSYSWDFDASNGIQADAVGMYVSTTFNTAKTYTVTLTVTDTIGQRSSHTVTVQVNPR
ncbi:MAG: PKD domain-containing protein [Methanolobus sp.]|uniref:PKD domain-containing protein n=1 Tax=Methanolobus sp. TaxID=1874737 RepID=UPI00273072E1|nr:PKD domain-containing protein [Methanolobus sp.]MDP2216034.1 PKD domain-containing protein [Methanolobus sp.]